MTRHDSRCTAVCLLFEYSFGGDRNEILENAANSAETRSPHLRKAFITA